MFLPALKPLIGLAALLLSCVASVAQAQDFPSKPLRIINWSAPGGNIDVLSRMVGEQLTRRWGQPVVVENRIGASGIIAAEAAARSAPDGYTLFFTTNTTQISNPLVKLKLPYDPVKDFEPLGELVAGQLVMVASATAPFNTLAEYVDYARKQPKGSSYGSFGIGTGAHLLGEQLSRVTGLKLTHVPYKGGELAAMNDVIGGNTDFTIMAQGNAKIHARAGKLKLLAVSGTKRNPGLPEVPTFLEQGYKGFEITGWIAAYVPAGTPAPVVQKLSAALRETIRMPEVVSRLEILGFDPVGSTPEQFRQSFDSAYKLWAELIRSAGIQPE